LVKNSIDCGRSRFSIFGFLGVYKTQMLLGLGHDRIVFLCQSYLDRGWITTEEYENLHDYLYVPYAKMHGNGTGKKMMAMVDKLPIKNVQKEIILPKCQDS
jgi:hypothetical protein